MKTSLSVLLLPLFLLATGARAENGCNLKVQKSVQDVIDQAQFGETLKSDLPSPSQLPDQQDVTILIPARDNTGAIAAVYEVNVNEVCQVMSVTRRI